MYPWQCKDCPPGIICSNGAMELCPSDRPFSEKGRVTSGNLDQTFSGISSEEQCQPCLNGFDCSPGRPRKLCPEGTFKKEANFTDDPYRLQFNLEQVEPFDKLLENSGWAIYECVECNPGTYCVGVDSELTSDKKLLVKPDKRPIGSVDWNLAEENDTIPTACPMGTYQPDSGKPYCIPCNAGIGEYCPEGTGHKV